MKYYILVKFYEETKSWDYEFGDYDKEVVIEEREDMLSHYKAKHLKVFTLKSDSTESIQAKLAQLNKASA